MLEAVAVALIKMQIRVVAVQSALLAQAAAEREALALQLLCYPRGVQQEVVETGPTATSQA
jgi:hypothetical protein